jgi:hypothetical protein
MWSDANTNKLARRGIQQNDDTGKTKTKTFRRASYKQCHVNGDAGHFNRKTRLDDIQMEGAGSVGTPTARWSRPRDLPFFSAWSSFALFVLFARPLQNLSEEVH